MTKLIVEKKGHITVLTLNRPEVLNAIDYELLQLLNTTMDSLRGDEDCWAVVIRGAGENFSAGVDVLSVLEMTEALGSDKVGAAFNLQIAMPGYEFEKPIFAAIEGNCVGFGLGIALAADIRICGEGVKFYAPEAMLGMPAVGIPITGPKVIGPGATMELLSVGQPLDKEWGLRVGLVQTLCETGGAFDEALASAEQCLRLAPLAVRAQKKIMQYSMDHSIAESLRFGVELRTEIASSSDYHEGVKAFAEKRRPKFIGG